MQGIRWQQLYYFSAITFCWVELNAQEGALSGSKNTTQQWWEQGELCLCWNNHFTSFERQTSEKKVPSTVHFGFHSSCHRLYYISFMVSFIYSSAGKTLWAADTPKGVLSWWGLEQALGKGSKNIGCVRHLAPVQILSNSSGTRKSARWEKIQWKPLHY